MTRDPVRLRDDPNVAGELRDLLTNARAPELDDAGLARLAEGLRLASPPVARPRSLGWLGAVLAAAAIAAVILWPRETPQITGAEPGVADALPTVSKQPTHALTLPRLAPAQHDPSVASTNTRAITKPVVATDPVAEAKLLLAARRALPADPKRALAHTSEHERRFPRGSMKEERELLAVRALMALGRSAEAVARAHRFESAYPGSTYAAAVRDAVE
jgi:hypothetical protein